jgi:hypothetical protein
LHKGIMAEFNYGTNFVWCHICVGLKLGLTQTHPKDEYFVFSPFSLGLGQVR